MAKALMGHLVSDPRLLAEVTSLRARVRVLESELNELKSAAIAGDIVDLDAVAVNQVEPVDLDSELRELRHAAHALA